MVVVVALPAFAGDDRPLSCSSNLGIIGATTTTASISLLFDVE
jgi:hypothetical protein